MTRTVDTIGDRMRQQTDIPRRPRPGLEVRAAIRSAMSQNGPARTIAVTMFDGRISPRFDAAGCLMLITAQGSRITGIASVRCGCETPAEKVRLLSGLGIDVLICGGLTQESFRRLEASGITLVPWARGEVGEVVQRYLQHHPAAAPGGRTRRGS